MARNIDDEDLVRVLNEYSPSDAGKRAGSWWAQVETVRAARLRGVRRTEVIGSWNRAVVTEDGQVYAIPQSPDRGRTLGLGRPEREGGP